MNAPMTTIKARPAPGRRRDGLEMPTSSPRVLMSHLASQMHLLRDGEPALAAPERGFVEALDEVVGLRGWIAGASPLQPPPLELAIDGEVVATAGATIHRPDIWASGHASHLSGFAFAPDELLAVAARADLSPSAALEVRVQGEPLVLGAAAAWRFADLTAWLAADEAADDDYLTGIGLALSGELKRLGVLARRGYSQPVSQHPARQVGVIEFVTPLGPHAFVVGGWMRHDQPLEYAAILVREGERHAGGVVCATRARNDLGPDARAFVGILALERPLTLARAPRDWALHFAGGTGHWLGAVQSLRIAEATVALDELERTLGEASTPRAGELRQFVRDHLPWTGAPGDERSGIKIGLDECHVLPGFGVFVAGWALAPMGRLRDIACRLGETVFQLDPPSLSLSARSDLAGPFPAYADRLERAGFAALLRGQGGADPRARWLLRFDFDSGARHLHEIALDRARIIDSDFDLHRLRSVYPGLETAPWLYEFADSLHAGRSAAEPVWLLSARCRNLLALALPPQRTHQTVALDQAEHALRALPADVGVGLLVPSTCPAGSAASWLEALRRAEPARALSALRLDPGAEPLDALPAMLAACAASAFVYVGPQVALRREGALAAAAFLAQGAAEGPTFFGVEALSGGQPVQSHDAAFFGWSADALARHAPQAPPLLGGGGREAAMSARAPAARVAAAPGAPQALRLQSAQRDAWLAELDQRLLAEHEARHRARTAALLPTGAAP